ncbi:MAG: hypothetical protein H8E94_02460 [Alphaproteobacteria bacterium]|nr:hypothetical protein [Alphaproteobacteria bacterium]
MVERLQIVGWDEYQHYSRRDPPWIKLHIRTLQSEDWVTLADASKLLMCVCLMLGARDGGRIPNNPDYIKRVAYLDKRPNLNPLIECGFLKKVQADASGCLQPHENARPETETETETEEELEREHPPKKSKRVSNLNDLVVDDDLREWGERTVPGIDLERTLIDLRLYCESHGKKYKDYRAALMKFATSDFKRRDLTNVPKGVIRYEPARTEDEDRAAIIAAMVGELGTVDGGAGNGGHPDETDGGGGDIDSPV